MNIYDEQKRNAFKPIKEGFIVLDFSNCKYLDEIHKMLKEKFGFPEYYGENWDALWDCLDDFFFAKKEFKVEIHGFYGMEESLREQCKELLEIFDDLREEYPSITMELIS